LDFLSLEFEGFRWSYWAVFGQFAVLMHGWAYQLLDAFLLLSALAICIFFLRMIIHVSPNDKLSPQILPALWIVILFILFVKYSTIHYASQGRLLFPAGFAIAYYKAGGLLWPQPKRWASFSAGLISLGMITFVAYVGSSVLLPAYAQ
jgi:hypothetical protein